MDVESDLVTAWWAADRFRCLVNPHMLAAMSLESQPEYDSKLLAMLRKLYPHASEEQLMEGKRVLERYVDVASRIAGRLEQHSKETDFDSVNESS